MARRGLNLSSLIEAGPDGAVTPLVRATLDTCPWAWPTGQIALRNLARVGITDGPPAPRPGHAPVLVDHGGEPVVFVCNCGTPDDALDPAPPEPDVRKHLEVLRATVSKYLPIRTDTSSTTFHAIDASKTAVAQLPPLQGRSLDLSVGIALAGQALGRSVPLDLAMSACVESDGHLRGVNGWVAKSRAVVQLLPQVSRLMVAKEDKEIASAAFAEIGGERDIKLIPVSTFGEALAEVFGEHAQRTAVSKLALEERPGLVRRLFSDALKGTSSFVIWKPAVDVIETAMAWPEIENDHVNMLRFSMAVASRYARERSEPPLPDERWVAGLPDSVRMQVAAHLLQHHVRWGAEPATWLEETAAEAIQCPGWPDCLRVRGARARLLDANGHHENALEEHRTVTRAWLDLFDPHEASYSLTEWLRLAGGLDHVETFESARRLADRLMSESAFDDNARMYVSMGLARGAWALSLKRDPSYAEFAKEHLDRVLNGSVVRPNWPRVQRVALRYEAYLDRTDQDCRRRLHDDPEARTDELLVHLHDGNLELGSFISELDDVHRWRAQVLLDQSSEIQHFLRFFVNA